MLVRLQMNYVGAFLVALSLLATVGCGGESAAVKKEMKNTVVSEDAKNVQTDIASKRKAERDFGKGKGKTPSGDAAPAK